MTYKNKNFRIKEFKKLRIGFFYPESSVFKPIDPDRIWTSDRGLTGSEYALFRYALGLSRLGHGVTIFTKFTKVGDLEKITCCPYQEWQQIYHSQPWDALCSWMTPEPLKIAQPDQFRFFNQQVSDFNMCESGWENYVDVLAPLSFSHASYLKTRTNYTGKWRILYNGVDTQEFKPMEKIAGKIIWASSHDRGLHWLLEAFPLIKSKVPHAELHVFYDMHGLHAFANRENSNSPQIRELKQRSQYTIEALKKLTLYGVHSHGSISRDRMIKEMNSAELLAYPCDPVTYTETFGVTVAEACAAGAIPVICAADAFKELWSEAVDHVDPPFSDHKDQFVELVVRNLTDSEYKNKNRERCVNHAIKFDWSNLISNLEEAISSKGAYGLPVV